MQSNVGVVLYAYDVVVEKEKTDVNEGVKNCPVRVIWEHMNCQANDNLIKMKSAVAS